MFKDNKKFVLESIFIKEALKQDLSLNEFLLLMYFEDAEDKTFNVDKISKILGIEEKDVLVSFNRLLSLNFIEVLFLICYTNYIVRRTCGLK